jgi:hypothetical protein
MLWNCCVCLARSSGMITQGSIMAQAVPKINQSNLSLFSAKSINQTFKRLVHIKMQTEASITDIGG